MVMNSKEINKSVAGATEEIAMPGVVGTEVLPTTPTSTGSIEPGVEAKENPKRKASWMKNIGSGMRTLRLRKHGGSDKKNETALNDLASASSVGDPDCEATASSGQHPQPPQIPLPPIPTDSPVTSTSIPPSPSSANTLPSKVKKKKSSDSSSSSIKNHTSRLSLREHVSKAKGKKGAVPAAGANGSVPREGPPTTQKTSSGPHKNGAGENLDKADPARFIGEGLSFKAKLIGILEVSGPRGDRICQEALSELKMAVKAAGEHKQKVTVHVALDGLRIRDEKTGDCLYHHQVHKISFIAQDLTDTRAFGYIFGSPDTGHRFFGIKTEKSASQVVMSMRDLFQVVFDLKKKEIERAKQQLEMQQKFLATRAAETATRSSQKSGIAETYIDGACSLGGSPTVHAAPAEADLLNLEVELTSLQEGLENIHSTLIDTATSHASFNRGSTASISSDPMNPGSATFNKYNLNNNFGSHVNVGGGGGIGQMIPPYMNTHGSGNQPSDPFGDSFDPFDASKGQSVVSPSFPADPFTNVDPFAGTKFAGGLESSEFLGSDPFETPVGGCTFSFPDSGGGRVINRQISITSNSSDISSGKASIGADTITTTGRPSLNSTLGLAHSPNLHKSEPFNSGFTPATVTNWTASFEENFANTNGDEDRNGGLGDLFTELDPLGTGRVKPFVDRKDFFQDLKNPPKKVLSEISAPPPAVVTTGKSNLKQVKENSLRPSLSVEKSASPLPNSFSTNFNPGSDSDGKIPPPNKTDSHLRTSSIRGAQLHGDTPPNYSPPPPPQQQLTTNTSSAAPSVYFVSAPPKAHPSPPPSAKKSPQLLRNMTISNAASSHVVTVSGPKTLPRSSFRLDKSNTVDIISAGGGEEIPNLTPPPRPPHTSATSSSSLNRSSVIPTALPRPHSGTANEGKRQHFSSSSSTAPVLPRVTAMNLPPEPPPRPFPTTNEPVLPPPPLPPKKQTIGPLLSNPLLAKVNYNASLKSRGSAEGGSNFNDLPLPLPSRKGQQNSSINIVAQLPRYAYPPEGSPVSSHSYGRTESFDETDHHHHPSSVSNLAKHKLPGLTMEAALNQVASMSLSQLAGKLHQSVEELSSCTIHDLAIKLTMMNLKHEETALAPTGSLSTLPQVPLSFESNFADEDGGDDFSTVSAPAATVFAKEVPRATSHHNRREEVQIPQPQYDKYAVFRELIPDSEGISGFSVCESQENLPIEEEEDGQRSRTLTSRGSSSEKTLQADFDTPGNGLSTLDDITDANFSEGDEEEEKSGLIDEVVDLNLKAEWATFESNFEEQFVPLAAEFSKSGESPWDSDAESNKSKFGPTDIVTQEIQLEKIKSPKKEDEHSSSQFDFQLFEKPLVSVDPVGRRNSRGLELRGGLVEPQPNFQRQSSGSSKHSERSLGPPPSSSRNVTTSDYSDSGKEKEQRSYRGRGGEEQRRSGHGESRNPRGRRYSREDSDQSSGKRKSGRRYYYEEEGEETGSRSPVERRRAHRRRQEDEEYYSNASSRHGQSRGTGSSRHPYSSSGKYYSQSLHRKDREGRYTREGTGRRPSESEKYSNHESDFDDTYEDERRRGRGRGGSSGGYSRSERDHHVSGSRPASSGGSGSGSRHRNPKYRDGSREYYQQQHHHHHREQRHGRPRSYAVPYHHSRNDDDFEPDGREREFSEYSGDEGSRRGRRYRGRRRVERDRPYYYDSPSWESETPPSGKEGDGGEDGGPESGEMKRGTRLRRSDQDRPRERSERDIRDRERPSSSSYHGDRLDGGNRKVSRYQSDLSLNANITNNKLSACEFGFDGDFSVGSHHQPPVQQLQQDPQRKLNLHVEPSCGVGGGSPSGKPAQSETSSNKSEPNSMNNVNKLSADLPLNHHHHHHQQPPPESPFEDNFLLENNIFFPADFSSTVVVPPPNPALISEENSTKVVNVLEISATPTNRCSLTKNGPESNSSGSAEKSDENEDNSSPGILLVPKEAQNHQHHSQQQQQKMIQIVRKPIISDTIHELPDTEMKKSDSFNIFDREKDPFADDDFFN